MKTIRQTFALATLVLATITQAHANHEATIKGRYVAAAGAINPPNPVESCNAAKQKTKEEADKAGFVVYEWKRLSVDSDCRLETVRAGKLGYYFIFHAEGEARRK